MTIGVAVAIHAAVSQFMYAGIGLHIAAPPEQIRDGASLMYLGGDLIEILLAFALLASRRSSHHLPNHRHHAVSIGSTNSTGRDGRSAKQAPGTRKPDGFRHGDHPQAE